MENKYKIEFSNEELLNKIGELHGVIYTLLEEIIELKGINLNSGDYENYITKINKIASEKGSIYLSSLNKEKVV